MKPRYPLPRVPRGYMTHKFIGLSHSLLGQDLDTSSSHLLFILDSSYTQRHTPSLLTPHSGKPHSSRSGHPWTFLVILSTTYVVNPRISQHDSSPCYKPSLIVEGLAGTYPATSGGESQCHGRCVMKPRCAWPRGPRGNMFHKFTLSHSLLGQGSSTCLSHFSPILDPSYTQRSTPSLLTPHPGEPHPSCSGHPWTFAVILSTTNVVNPRISQHDSSPCHKPSLIVEGLVGANLAANGGESQCQRRGIMKSRCALPRGPRGNNTHEFFIGLAHSQPPRQVVARFTSYLCTFDSNHTQRPTQSSPAPYSGKSQSSRSGHSRTLLVTLSATYVANPRTSQPDNSCHSRYGPSALTEGSASAYLATSRGESDTTVTELLDDDPKNTHVFNIDSVRMPTHAAQLVRIFLHATIQLGYKLASLLDTGALRGPRGIFPELPKSFDTRGSSFALPRLEHAVSFSAIPTVDSTRRHWTLLTKLQKARLRLWLLRHPNGTNLLRAIVNEVCPLLASHTNLKGMLKQGIALFSGLPLQGPPLYLYRRIRYFHIPTDEFSLPPEHWSPAPNVLPPSTTLRLWTLLVSSTLTIISSFVGTVTVLWQYIRKKKTLRRLTPSRARAAQLHVLRSAAALPNARDTQRHTLFNQIPRGARTRRMRRIALMFTAPLLWLAKGTFIAPLADQATLQHLWWHQGLNALGRERSSCEEGDHVAMTRSHTTSRIPPAKDHILTEQSKAIPIRGLAHLKRKPVCVKVSLIEGAGRGLFAARDICTYADNIKTRAQQLKFKICPYVGDSPSNQPSDYVISVGGVTVDAIRGNSCWPRFVNDPLDSLLDNTTVMLEDGLIWLVPLPGVEILKDQEYYMSYDWEFWYRRWNGCGPELRAQIVARYPVSSSLRAKLNSLTTKSADVQRTSDFWYSHWTWWPLPLRRDIRRHFPIDQERVTLYPFDAPTLEYEEEVDSDFEEDPAIPDEPRDTQEHCDSTWEVRRHSPHVPAPSPNPLRQPAPRMLGPASAPNTRLLPQSEISQADRPDFLRVRRHTDDPNPARPSNANRIKPPQVWAAESRRPNKVPTNMYSDISRSHWKKFCSTIDTWRHPGDDLVSSIPTTADIRTGFLNVNGLEDHNYDYILWFFEDKKLDVLFLLDTRLTVLGGQFANAKIKERLGNDILVLQSKTRPVPGSGGQIAIVRPHLRQHLYREETDPANLGVLFALTFRHGPRRLALISVYWPCDTQGPESLRSRLSQYMMGTTRRGTLTDYCKHLVENVLDRTMEDPMNTCIIGGDWNSNWQDSASNPRRSHPSIAGWAKGIGLLNPHDSMLPEGFKTRYPSVTDEDHSASTIDHVLTTSSSAFVTEAGINNAPVWHAITDHRPLWVAVRLETALDSPVDKVEAIPNIRRVELDRKDHFSCEEYRAHLRTLVIAQPAGGRTGEDLGAWIESICASSVNIARSHMKPPPKKNRRRRDGWTATYFVLNKMMESMIRIRQFLTGQAGRTQWPDWYAPIGVKKEIDRLRVFATREFPDFEQRDKVLCTTGRDPTFWLTTMPTELDMTTEVKAILKAIHGRKRSEKRREHRTLRRNKEQARLEGKYARWIRSLVGKQRIPFDMDKLPLLDGTTEYDPVKIHSILTEWFGKWFSADRNRVGTFHDGEQWASFLNDRKTFDELLTGTSCPDWVKESLWNSMHLTASKLSYEARAELAVKLNTPPTYSEFVQRLIKPHGGPTAGLTGLTFNMMAEWPAEVMESIYKALLLLEETKTTPLHWKNKALIPMPKAINPTLEQLRPLMLIEVLRKVWCSFSVNIVWEFLEKHKVLEDIQFAYRRNREAGVAQLCLRNAIEEAQETESAILLGSYDKYHAFDSLTRSVMKLSFSIVGLGGPEASRLVDMEDDSHVTVTTPLARHHWASKYSRMIHTGDDALNDPAFLIPLQGTPQGDTISCLTWSVFENICLATLRTDPGRVKLYIRGANGLIYEAADLCYADDLNTISPTLAGMQRKADIIGGLAEVLHLRISIKKLRQIATDFGAQKLLPSTCELQLNDGTGNIETLAIPAKGPFDQLGYRNSVGVLAANQNPDMDQYQKLRSLLVSACRSLQRKSATAGCKLAALHMSIFNTALWRAQCSPWTLEMCQVLDYPINRLLRHITKNLPGFPNKLLYGAAPGLNLPRLSDLIQIRKLALEQRGMTNPSTIAAGPNGLIQRSARFYGLACIPGNRMSFGPAAKHYWASSLLNRLDHCALCLTIGGRDPTGTHEEQINTYDNQRSGRLRSKQTHRLVNLGIHTFGDLLEQSTTTSRWTDTGLLDLNFLDLTLESRNPVHIPNRLRPGTCWSMPDGTILEFLGTLAEPAGPPLMFKRWICPSGQRMGSKVRLSEDTPSLGAGTDLILHYHEVWPGQLTTRAILETDDSTPRRDKGITRTLVREFSQLSPSTIDTTPIERTPAQHIAHWLMDNGIAEGEYEIFTDGGWKDNTPFLERQFYGSDQDSTFGSASVVCLPTGPDRWTKPGLITHIAPTPGLYLASGYPCELTALLCASQVALSWRPAAIITDCEAAIGLIQKGSIPRAEQKKDNATLARLLVRYSRKLKPTLFRHTHAHLDQYLPAYMHTQDQRGNILADHAAGLSEHHEAWIQEHYPQLTRSSTTFQAVHEALIIDIPLCVTNGSIPILTSLHNTFSKQNFTQYISDRLTKTAHGNLYRDASYSFCTEVFDLNTADITQRASAVRLIFDKVWQPWNIRKYKRQTAPLCAHCEVEDSLGHLLRDCTHPNIHNLRAFAMVTARKVVSEGDDLLHIVFDAMLEVMSEELGESIWRGLWLPQHVESFRQKLARSNIISLDPRCITYDSLRARSIHSATLDIAKIFGQAALNMMRERTAMTHDLNNPLQIVKAGKNVPPPLALYNFQKKFRKKTKAKAPPVPLTTRVTSMHPPFVREKRKHPRVLAQELKLAEIQVKVTAAAVIARARDEHAAIVYSEPFLVEPEVIQPWDARVVPYLELPEMTDILPTRDEINELELRQIANQAERARIFEDIMHTREMEEIRERRRIEALESWNDPENVESRRRQTHRRGHLSRASIEAREAERRALTDQARLDPRPRVNHNSTPEPRGPRGNTSKLPALPRLDRSLDDITTSSTNDSTTTQHWSRPGSHGNDIPSCSVSPRGPRDNLSPRGPRGNLLPRGPRGNTTSEPQSDTSRETHEDSASSPPSADQADSASAPQEHFNQGSPLECEPSLDTRTDQTDPLTLDALITSFDTSSIPQASPPVVSHSLSVSSVCCIFSPSPPNSRHDDGLHPMLADHG